MERPLLVPLGSLIFGLWAAHLLDSTPPAWGVLALLLATLLASFLKSSVPFLISLATFFFLWGGFSLSPFLNPAGGLAPLAAETPVLIEGVVDQRPEGAPSGGARVFIRVERLYREGHESAASGRLLVAVQEGRVAFFTGDRVLFSSKIRRPRSLGLPGEIDYPRRLAYQGVFATGFVKTPGDLVLLAAGHGLGHELDRLAARLGDFIAREAPGDEGAVLKALLLGDKGDVPEELNDAYAAGGVNHILSISGFHVGIIYLCCFQLLYLAARCSEFLALRLNIRKALLLTALPVVVFYLFLSGTAPATVRSVLMIAALVAALQLKREADPLNSLLLAACAILLAAPQTLFDVSFQLSFLAIWGLVVLAPPLTAPFAALGQEPEPGGRRRASLWALRWSLLLLAASAAAILATLVPVAYYFHRVSLIGLLANLAVVPLMGYGAVVIGFASLPLSFIAPSAAASLVKAAACFIRLSDAIILQLARAPVFSGYAPTGLDALLACLALCALGFTKSRTARLLGAVLPVVVLLVRAIPAGTGGGGLLTADFLSVGQGDAALVTLPDGKRLLVDGGGRAGDREERIGGRLLMPALSRLGVGRIDYLALSHEHPDHLQGVLYLARSFEIGEFWESGIPSRSPEYLRLKWLLAARGIPVRRLDAAAGFTAGGATVEPLWPPPSHRLPGQGAADPNDDSLVFRLRHGRSSLLLTGDLGTAAEEELLSAGVPLQATLLKVGHHGSKYASSDSFLRAVSPRAAVISAGYGNPFHLPAPSTLKRLQRRGIRTYRTDLDGTVRAVCAPDGTLAVTAPWGHFN